MAKRIRRGHLAYRPRTPAERLVRILRLWARIYLRHNEDGCGYFASQLRRHADHVATIADLDIALEIITFQLELGKNRHSPGTAGTGGWPMRLVARNISGQMDRVAKLARYQIDINS